MEKWKEKVVFSTRKEMFMKGTSKKEDVME